MRVGTLAAIAALASRVSAAPIPLPGPNEVPVLQEATSLASGLDHTSLSEWEDFNHLLSKESDLNEVELQNLEKYKKKFERGPDDYSLHPYTAGYKPMRVLSPEEMTLVEDVPYELRRARLRWAHIKDINQEAVLTHPPPPPMYRGYSKLEQPEVKSAKEQMEETMRSGMVLYTGKKDESPHVNHNVQELQAIEQKIVDKGKKIVTEDDVAGHQAQLTKQQQLSQKEADELAARLKHGSKSQGSTSSSEEHGGSSSSGSTSEPHSQQLGMPKDDQPHGEDHGKGETKGSTTSHANEANHARDATHTERPAAQGIANPQSFKQGDWQQHYAADYAQWESQLGQGHVGNVQHGANGVEKKKKSPFRHLLWPTVAGLLAVAGLGEYGSQLCKQNPGSKGCPPLPPKANNNKPAPNNSTPPNGGINTNIKN